MKIAINCAFYQPRGGGIKEYIHNLINQLAQIDIDHEIVLYVLEDQIEYARENLPPKFRLKKIPFKSKSKIDKIKRSLLEQNFWAKDEKEEKFDIFHSPFFHAPKLKRAKVLLTVHDLRLYRFPDTYEFFRYHFLKHKVKSSIKKADHIISISEFTKKEIIELCGKEDSRITVIHEAINPERFKLKDNKLPADVPEILNKKRFLLSVGHLEPRKNYDRLIVAFNNLRKEDELKDLQLVIVGKKDHSFEKTLDLMNKTEGVHYLNFVSHEALLWLYKNASLFVFPSYYEGFGFPPLEAAALGTVSAVSNVSSIPEVCGEAVFYFDPFNSEELKSVLLKALTDREAFESKLNSLPLHLNKFSWRKNAEETKKVYDELGN